MNPDKLDIATDAVKAQAEEAHLLDRSATLSALADCERALKRIARRASVAEGWDRIEIKQGRGPTIEFTGRLLVDDAFETRGRDPLQIKMEIWETRAGALVAASYASPVGREGFEDARVTVVPLQDDTQAMRFAVLEHFEWEQRARSMVTKRLDWSLRQEME